MKEDILTYRKEHNLSKTQFCVLCGISRSMLYCIEKGYIDKPKNAQHCGRIEKVLYGTIDKSKYTCYFILNRYNNKKYIGITSNLKQRLHQHFYNLKLKNHPNDHLQFDYNQFQNFDNPFVYGVLEENIPENKKAFTEIKYINDFKTYDEEFGYNIRANKTGREMLNNEDDYVKYFSGDDE